MDYYRTLVHVTGLPAEEASASESGSDSESATAEGDTSRSIDMSQNISVISALTNASVANNPPDTKNEKLDSMTFTFVPGKPAPPQMSYITIPEPRLPTDHTPLPSEIFKAINYTPPVTTVRRSQTGPELPPTFLVASVPPSTSLTPMKLPGPIPHPPLGPRKAPFIRLSDESSHIISIAVHRMKACERLSNDEIGYFFDHDRKWVTKVLKSTNPITGVLLENLKKPMGRKPKTAEDHVDVAIRKYVDEFHSTSSKEISAFLQSNGVANVSHKVVYGRLKKMEIPMVKKPPGPAAERYRRTTKYIEDQARKRLKEEKKVKAAKKRSK